MENIGNIEQKLEDYINKNIQNGIWKSYIEIETIIGIDIHCIILYLDNDDGLFFCRNSKGKYTTRKMYEKYTRFWSKFRDIFTNKIK